MGPANAVGGRAVPSNIINFYSKSPLETAHRKTENKHVCQTKIILYRRPETPLESTGVYSVSVCSRSVKVELSSAKSVHKSS